MKDPTRLAAIKALRPTPGPHQTRFIYRMIRGVRRNASALGLMLNSDESRDWQDAEMFVAAADPEYGLQALAAEVERLQERECGAKVILYPKCGRTSEYLGCQSCAVNLSGSSWMKYCPNCGRKLKWK